MSGDNATVVLGLGLATAGATLIGGAMAIRFRAALALLASFSTGAVLGVALFDLLPQALTLAPNGGPLGVTAAMAAGFMLYLTADRLALAIGQAQARAHIGPASLTLHSLVDGLSIGLAFNVSVSAGVLVAIAVLAHDLLDGANTVVVSLAGGSGVRGARRWLALDAFAPLAGLMLAHFIPMTSPMLALVLALFAGGFLYVAVHELLPRTQGAGGLRSAGLIAAGLFFIYSVVRLAT